MKHRNDLYSLTCPIHAAHSTPFFFVPSCSDCSTWPCYKISMHLFIQPCLRPQYQSFSHSALQCLSHVALQYDTILHLKLGRFSAMTPTAALAVAYQPVSWQTTTLYDASRLCQIGSLCASCRRGFLCSTLQLSLLQAPLLTTQLSRTLTVPLAILSLTHAGIWFNTVAESKFADQVHAVTVLPGCAPKAGLAAEGVVVAAVGRRLVAFSERQGHLRKHHLTATAQPVTCLSPGSSTGR